MEFLPLFIITFGAFLMYLSYKMFELSELIDLEIERINMMEDLNV